MTALAPMASDDQVLTRGAMGRLDRLLATRRAPVAGWRGAASEMLWFGATQARACVFAGLFFLAVFLVPREGLLGVGRYDLLLVIALGLQAWLLWARVETPDEARAIVLFHLAGFVLELYKTSGPTPSWTYPDPAVSKVWGVPLFAGFMYAAVGSYIMQAWRLLRMRIQHHPPYAMAGALAAAFYLNLFTNRYLPDARWLLLAVAVGLYARCWIVFTPRDRERRMPYLVGFVLVGFFIWVAENLGTFHGIWLYPDQLRTWTAVSLGKWSSWTMLAIMSFALVAHLKHVKARIHLAP